MTDKDEFLRELQRGLRREGVVAPRRKAIVADAAARIDEAAADAGPAEAVAAMGDPIEVARELAEIEREHPVRVARWGRGFMWAGATVVALFLIQVVHIPTFGVVKELDPLYGPSYWDFSLWPLFKVWGDTNNGVVLDVHVGVLAYLVVPLVAFLLASCFWRALGRDTLHPVTERRG
jgi:hypothetical protein